MTDDIIERCCGDMDRARCEGLTPSYWLMTQDMRQKLASEMQRYADDGRVEFLGLRAFVTEGVADGAKDPQLVATGIPDTAQSLLEEASEIIRQCADTDAVEEKLYAHLMDWMRRYNKQKENN